MARMVRILILVLLTSYCSSPEENYLKEKMRLMPSVVVFSTGAHYSSIKFSSLDNAWSNFQRDFQRGLKLLCSGPVKAKSADILVWKSATPHFFNRDLGNSLRKGINEDY